MNQYEVDLEVVLLTLAGSPEDPGRLAPDLAGWVAPSGLFLCTRCAGRIFRRGCRLPLGSVYTLVPAGEAMRITVRECVGCGVVSATMARPD